MIKNIRLTDVNAFSKKEQLRDFLGLKDVEDFSILQWYPPAAARPQEAAYILIKRREPGGWWSCCPGAYERGAFRGVLEDWDRPIPLSDVLGWTYAPWDDRTDALGALREEDPGSDL